MRVCVRVCVCARARVCVGKRVRAHECMRVVCVCVRARARASANACEYVAMLVFKKWYLLIWQTCQLYLIPILLSSKGLLTAFVTKSQLWYCTRRNNPCLSFFPSLHLASTEYVFSLSVVYLLLLSFSPFSPFTLPLYFSPSHLPFRFLTC